MKKVCIECYKIGKPKKIYKGSIFIELLLWMCFIIPGLIYSIWRQTSTYYACSSCGGHLIDIDSQRGQIILSNLSTNTKTPRTTINQPEIW